MSPPRSAWRPAPLLTVSLVWHVAMGCGWLAQPAGWPWWLAGLAGNHLLIMAVGLWPRSTWLGPNLTCLPPEAQARGEVAITIDDGPDPDVTPAVLEVLARRRAPATFFFIGANAQAHPALCQAVVAAGHDVQNHGQRHPHLASLMGPAGWRQEVGQGADTLAHLTGRAPRFYRAVAGLRNPCLDPVLHALGLRLASWTRRGFDTRCTDVDTVLRRLCHQLQAGDIVLLHDGHAARTADGTPMIVAVLPRLLDELTARGLTPVTLTHACSPPSNAPC